MKKSECKTGEGIEVQEMNVILKIPKEAARIDITAHMFDDDGELMKITKSLTVSEIRDARKDFVDNVEDGDDYDVRYFITDSGREWLDALSRGHADAMERLQNMKITAEDGDEQ